ncbi:MAG: proton-translocating NADH-quinone oxidoreductase, chain [Pseudonocardia sp.]|uniref:complex I subunit 4 family protein n=1 Tax=Pseudonocardia sp. TaxID=60912 RepID=UPI002608D9B8|nr:NADH-quinone oxidoreductase subunit M [Pseudonocardia sp.]MCU1628269.1 proton-translocating NADH-quinone oxidoreductase, chain [Pseudonocardia sp.]MDT7698447.1 NADH-quinone oxidoreductase subunit [Pseudonocardiales bacterium]
MLSLIVFWPALVGAVLLCLPARLSARLFVGVWIAAGVVDLALVVAVWLRLPRQGYGFEERLPWIPSAGISYHLGVDGLSLPLLALTAVLFLACAVFALRETRRVKSYVVLFLALQTVSSGLFAALDLILFFLFFDLSIVLMYFVIAGWGHGERARAAALKFFLYTFLGSLALLLGIIALFLAAVPHTFDIPALAAANPLAGGGLYAGLTLLALGVGLAVKTPTVPFHTWLPPAHTEAPATGSAILAGVLLKMGAYGFVRIAMPLLPAGWRQYALVVVIVGVVSVVYGALVALAQTDVKRMIAYTSINHMGYVVLGVGAAGLVAGSDVQARALATTGAVTQMVSHGLITGALFLLAGVLHERGGTYDMRAYSGLAARTPRFAALFAVAAFASLGLPGFSGFIAEFQVFTGALGAAPVPTALAVTGILVTAALFLLALQRLFLGPLRTPDAPGAPRPLPDVRVSEALAVAPLLALALVIGILPRFLLDVIEPAARGLVELVAR